MTLYGIDKKKGHPQGPWVRRKDYNDGKHLITSQMCFGKTWKTLKTKP